MISAEIYDQLGVLNETLIHLFLLPCSVREMNFYHVITRSGSRINIKYNYRNISQTHLCFQVAVLCLLCVVVVVLKS